MKKRTKIILLSAASGIAVLLAVYAYLLLSDGPPVQDADLRVARRQVAPEENGFELVNFTQEDLWEDPEYPIQESLNDEYDPAWSAAKSAELIEKNAEPLKALEECLERSEFQGPADLGFLSDYSYLTAWSKIAHLVSHRVRLHLEAGETAEALADAFKQIRFGLGIQESQGNLVTFMIGLGIENWGLRNLQRVVEESEVSAEVLRPYVASLGDLRLAEGAEADVYRVEYSATADLIDDLVQGGGDVNENLEVESGFYSTILLNPNDTKRLLAKPFRTLVENADKPWRERPHVGEESDPFDGFPKATVPLGPVEIPVPLRNYQGRMIYALMVPSIGLTQRHRHRTEFLRASTRTLLALEGYKNEAGDLPETLDDLVPEYLDAVPLDPFDGKPLRYSREKRIIWSVGIDLEDAGGAEIDPERRSQTDDEEPTCAVRV